MIEIPAGTITFVEDGEQKEVTFPTQEFPTNATRIEFDGTAYKCYFIGDDG